MAAWPSRTWRLYKCWAVVRALGRWPFAVLGAGDVPYTTTCPLCQEPDATIQHLLHTCPCTLALYHGWYAAIGFSTPSRSSIPVHVFFETLFKGRLGAIAHDIEQCRARVTYVGESLILAAHNHASE